MYVGRQEKTGAEGSGDRCSPIVTAASSASRSSSFNLSKKFSLHLYVVPKHYPFIYIFYGVLPCCLVEAGVAKKKWEPLLGDQRTKKSIRKSNKRNVCIIK